MKQPLNSPDNTVKIDDERQDSEYFDRYLQKDSPLSRQYQVTPTPEPSEQLNQTILAAAQKQASKNHWWHQPSSWVATIAIVCLAGLLSHNIWQTEQENLKQEITPSIIAPEPSAFSEEKVESVGAVQSKPIVRSTAKSQPLSAQPAKKAFSTDQTKDSRGLRFKSTSAPVMPRSAASLSSPPSEKKVLNEEDVHVIQSTTNLRPSRQIMDTTKSKEKQLDSLKQDMKQQLTAPQWLNKIKYLIEQGQYQKARQQLSKFRQIHPEYPVDPIILEQLSPY